MARYLEIDRQVCYYSNFKLSVMKKVSYILSLVLMVAILLTSAVYAQDRKGWSPQAKGTVIGAGAGALGGAVIHKRNRAVGGVVGGVVGGAAGYAIGKHTDNKRKEAARVAAANRAAAARAAERRASTSRVAVAKRNQSSRSAQAVNAAVPAAAAYAAYNAAQPATMYDAYGNPIPQVMNTAYLPNPSFGDPSKPYSQYEYRRKSW